MALPQYAKAVTVDDINELNEEYNLDELLDETEQDDDELAFVRELVETYFPTYNGDNLKYIVERISNYYANYEFNEGADKFLVVSAVADEVELRELYKKRAKADVEARIEKVKKGYLSTLEALKTLKKQGTKLDSGKNKLTMYLDDLTRQGKLNISFDEYGDEIDVMLKKFEEGMRATYYEG